MMKRDYLAEALKRANGEEGKRLMQNIDMYRGKRPATKDEPSYDEFMSILKEGLPDIEEKFAKIEDGKARALIGPLVEEIREYSKGQG